MKAEYLLYAKQTLEEGNYTCVLYEGETKITSKKRGVAPLLEWVEEGRNFENFVSADKVIGKAAAFLYVLLHIGEVYAGVISKSAAQVFQTYGVNFTYDVMAERIINRAGTGFCPMEEATKDIERPEEALTAIKKKIIELNK